MNKEINGEENKRKKRCVCVLGRGEESKNWMTNKGAEMQGVMERNLGEIIHEVKTQRICDTLPMRICDF